MEFAKKHNLTKTYRTITECNEESSQKKAHVKPDAQLTPKYPQKNMNSEKPNQTLIEMDDFSGVHQLETSEEHFLYPRLSQIILDV
ncbi:hypothetical protein JTB14_028144 [Gonioctena quinquepunctata]|nr:hypothetical protein JTB14_028144 [Gonioctena quinquepunctata]